MPSSYLKVKGSLKVGAVHDIAEAGTLEEYLDKYVGHSASSYVVPILVRIGAVRVKKVGRHVEIY
jgi:hypothetical protein